jgi:hypothetical protein
MKRNTIISVFIFLFGATAFASQPLDENFEGYKINATQGIDVRNPNGAWRAHDKNSMRIGVVENPNKSAVNPSAKVLRIDRPVLDTLTQEFATHVAWRGTYTISYEIPFTEKNCVIEMKILKKTGGQVGVRIYPDSEKLSQADYKIVKANLVASPDWQVVRFDFSSIVSKMTSYPKFNFEVEKSGNLDAQKSELTVFIDDIKIVEK